MGIYPWIWRTIMNTSAKKIETPQEHSKLIKNIAESILNTAIDKVFFKISPVKNSQELKMIFQNPDFMSRFKYALAESIGCVLGDFDSNVKEVFIFEPCKTEKIDTMVNILLIIESKTAGMEAFIASLNRALTELILQLPLPTSSYYHSILDIIFITQKEIDTRTGYAAIVSSIYAPVLKVWQRS
jgi:hypothetical protein